MKEQLPLKKSLPPAWKLQVTNFNQKKFFKRTKTGIKKEDLLKDSKDILKNGIIRKVFDFEKISSYGYANNVIYTWRGGSKTTGFTIFALNEFLRTDLPSAYLLSTVKMLLSAMKKIINPNLILIDERFKHVKIVNDGEEVFALTYRGQKFLYCLSFNSVNNFIQNKTPVKHVCSEEVTRGVNMIRGGLINAFTSVEGSTYNQVSGGKDTRQFWWFANHVNAEMYPLTDWGITHLNGSVTTYAYKKKEKFALIILLELGEKEWRDLEKARAQDNGFMTLDSLGTARHNYGGSLLHNFNFTYNLNKYPPNEIRDMLKDFEITFYIVFENKLFVWYEIPKGTWDLYFKLLAKFDARNVSYYFRVYDENIDRPPTDNVYTVASRNNLTYGVIPLDLKILMVNCFSNNSIAFENAFAKTKYFEMLFI